MPSHYGNAGPAQTEPMPWEPDTRPAAPDATAVALSSPTAMPAPASLELPPPSAPANATSEVFADAWTSGVVRPPAPGTPAQPGPSPAPQEEQGVLERMFPSAAKAIKDLTRSKTGERMAPGGELKNIRTMISKPVQVQGGLGPFTPPQYRPMQGGELDPLKVALGALEDLTTFEGRAWGAISPTQEFGDPETGYLRGARESVQKWTDDMQERLLQEIEADPSLRNKIASRYAIGAAEVENFIAQSALTFAENPLTAALFLPIKGASLFKRAFHGGMEAAGLERKLQFGFESAPPPGMATTTNYDDLLAAHKKSIEPIIMPDGGQNRILVETGLKPAAQFDAPGIYKGVVSPNTRYEFRLSYDPKTDITTTNRVRVAAEAHRRAFSQEAVGYYHPLRASVKDAKGISIRLGRPFTDKELTAISGHVKESIGHDISGSPFKNGIDLFAEGADPKKLMDAVGNAVDDLGLTADASYWKPGKYSDLIFENNGKGVEDAFKNSAIAGRSFELVDDIRNRSQATAAEAAVAAEAARKAGAAPGISQVVQRPGRLGPRPGALQLDETISAIVGAEEANPKRNDAGRAIFKMLGLDANPGQDTKKLFMNYPLHGIKHKLDEYLKQTGYTYEMFGGKYGPPNFKRSYDQKNVWIFDPSAEHGSFFDEDYTKMWRVPHEIAHAETNKILTQMYGGEGKRLGALGIPTVFKGRDVPPLSLADALRALDWEDFAFRYQRGEYKNKLGIKISDADFKREYTANMADAAHRVLTGDFSDPGVLGILPKALSPKQVLNDAKNLIRQRADDLGLDKAEKYTPEKKGGAPAAAEKKGKATKPTRQVPSSKAQREPDTRMMAEETAKYDSDEAFMRAGGFSIAALDRAAFGFAADDIKTMMPREINIKHKVDMTNPPEKQRRSGKSKKEWAEGVDLSTPVDVVFEKGKFYLEDGHHRYYAAKILGKPLNISLQINEKPIAILSGTKKYNYEKFTRDQFNKLKGRIN